MSIQNKKTEGLRDSSMKKQAERWIALVICLCIWGNCMVPLYAAGAQPVSFSPENTSVTTSDSAQTVAMKVQLEETLDIDYFVYHVMCDSPIRLVSAVHGTTQLGRDKNGNDYLVTGSNRIMDTDHLGVLTFEIPANTEAGTYAITLESQDGGVLIGDDQKSLSAQAIIQVTEGSSQTGTYTAALSCAGSATLGENIGLSVTVSGSAFASAAYTLEYDAARLSLKSVSAGEYSNQNGQVIVVDYGATKAVPYTYTITFQTILDGAATVVLTEAAFGTSDSAETGNLTEATFSQQSLTVTIAKREFPVTLPDIFEGNTMATEGKAYTFKAKDWANYDYGMVTVTMGDSSFTVSPDTNGNYTVENVTGALTISGTRTPKQYIVTFRTDTHVDLPADGEITYGTDYSFTMPTEENYAVSVTSIQCNSTSVDFAVEGKTVTVAGTDILGDLVITLDKVRTNAAVTVTGNAASELEADAAVAQPNKAFSATLHADSRYDYQVKATVNGKEVTLIQNGNVFTIAAEDVEAGSIEFTVTKTLKTDDFQVSQYLQFDGTMVWLVTNEVEQTNGSVYTYDGDPMFWSEEYNAYCCLVIAQTSEAITADKLGLQNGNAVSIEYDMDVNHSGKVDMNDAQLTYNLYNNKYQSFSSTVTMEKLLRADVNGSGNVDTEDACAIVNSILGK